MLCVAPVGPNKLVLQAYHDGEMEVAFQLCDNHARQVGEAMMQMSPLAKAIYGRILSEKGWLG
jgi:hypothetical protein